MKMYDLIYKKREGEELTSEEIDFIVQGITSNNIPDYQISAWAMAVYFQGMTARETSFLTKSVAKSGDLIDLSSIEGVKLDKHSTGGVGDTTSLILVPLVSASGAPVPKMSGRGLGHTGGTIDKLDSIPGYKTELSKDKFIDQINSIGGGIISQSGNLTPADKKLYSIRDVTATVDSIPLATSSIMSKKIAGGADSIVLDVKTGNGSFMPELEDARSFASLMVKIGSELNRKTIALITDMSQPLGEAVGNSLEVKEAIKVLKNDGPEDLINLCIKIGAHMLVSGDYIQDISSAEKKLSRTLSSGEALEKMIEIIKAQGGDPRIVDNPNLLPEAEITQELTANQDGFIYNINAKEVGLIAMDLGAGRSKKEDDIDLSAGIEIFVKKGDEVKKNKIIAKCHTNSKQKNGLQNIIDRFHKAIDIRGHKPQPQDFFIDVIS